MHITQRKIQKNVVGLPLLRILTVYMRERNAEKRPSMPEWIISDSRKQTH